MHLGIVTIGILIALSLEGLVEWRHHQELAAEARANIGNELRDNKAELDRLLKKAPEMTANYTDALKFLKSRQAHGNPDKKSLTLGWSVTTLDDSSWTTAQTVGALSYMGYGEVKQYAPVYKLQDQFLRLQEKTLDSATASLAFFATGDDPRTIPESLLGPEIDKMEQCLAAITAETQIGAGLQKQYSEVLGKSGAKRAE